MKIKLIRFFSIFIILFVLDQVVKYGFAVHSWNYDGSYMSLNLAYNYGVAFSLLSFLAQYLKYIQLIILFFGFIYLYKNQDVFFKYHISISLICAGGISNILDRFTYGGVVDYFYWHYGFEFAIFNLADVFINIAIAIIIYIQIKESRNDKKKV